MTDTVERHDVHVQRPFDNPIRGLMFCLLAYAIILTVIGLFLFFT